MGGKLLEALAIPKDRALSGKLDLHSQRPMSLTVTYFAGAECDASDTVDRRYLLSVGAQGADTDQALAELCHALLVPLGLRVERGLVGVTLDVGGFAAGRLPLMTVELEKVPEPELLLDVMTQHGVKATPQEPASQPPMAQQGQSAGRPATPVPAQDALFLMADALRGVLQDHGVGFTPRWLSPLDLKASARGSEFTHGVLCCAASLVQRLREMPPGRQALAELGYELEMRDAA